MIDPQLSRRRVPAVTRRGALRQFAGLWLLVFGLLAFSSAFWRDEPRLAIALAIVAAGVGVPGLFRPCEHPPRVHRCACCYHRRSVGS